MLWDVVLWGGNLMAPPLYEPPAGGAVHGRDAVPAAEAQARGAGHGHDQGLQLHALLHQPHAGHAQGGGREARPVLGRAQVPHRPHDAAVPLQEDRGKGVRVCVHINIHLQ